MGPVAPITSSHSTPCRAMALDSLRMAPSDGFAGLSLTAMETPGRFAHFGAARNRGCYHPLALVAWPQGLSKRTAGAVSRSHQRPPRWWLSPPAKHCGHWLWRAIWHRAAARSTHQATFHPRAAHRFHLQCPRGRNWLHRDHPCRNRLRATHGTPTTSCQRSPH